MRNHSDSTTVSNTRNLFDYIPVPDVQRPPNGGFLQVVKKLGPITNAEESDTALQAKRIFSYIEKAVEANPNIRIRLIYSANNDQATLIHLQNRANTWSTDAISDKLRRATGQGKLFHYLATHIEAAVQKGEFNKDNVQILPFATSMFGTDNPHFIKVKKDNKLIKQYRLKGNIVTERELERDVFAGEAAVQSGCQVFAIAGPDNTYSIGGGQSAWFNTTDLVHYDGCSQGKYVQEQLKRIARYEPAMTVAEFKEAMRENLVENEFTFVEQKTYEKRHESTEPEIRAIDMQSYRPSVLLTSAEARQDYSRVTSAQLPCLITVPADDKYEAIRILSWNIMEKGVSSGFVVANKQDILQEDRELQIARFMQLAFTVYDAVEKNNPHCITLQGVTHRKDIRGLAQTICDTLGDDWAIADSQEVIMGTVTLFNKTLFNQEKPAVNNFKINGHSVSLKSILNPANSFVIYNIFPDAQAPNQLFMHIHEVINRDKAHKHIVAGEFNTFLPPVHTEKQNIITGTVPSVDAQKTRFQGATASVGALYGQVVDNTMRVYLADLEYLNPEGGEILTEQQSKPLDTRALPKQQAQEILQFRPVLTPDYRLLQKQWMPGKTIEAIYREISPIAKSCYQGTDLLAGGDIFITEARNFQNDVVLAVMFPRITFKNKEKNVQEGSEIRHKHQLFLKIFESPEMSYFSSQSTKGMDMLCIPQENLYVLFDLLKALQAREALVTAIQKEFYTYNHAGFWTGSRSVDKTQAGIDEQSILDHIHANAPLLALVTIIKINKRYIGNKVTHESTSYGKRLQAIQAMLIRHYPFVAKVVTLPLMYENAHDPKRATKLLKRIQEFLSNTEDFSNNFYSELFAFIKEIDSTFRIGFDDDGILLEFLTDKLMNKETHEYPQLIQHLVEYKVQKDNRDLVSFVHISKLLQVLDEYQDSKSLAQVEKDREQQNKMQNADMPVKQKQDPGYMVFYTDLVTRLISVQSKLCDKTALCRYLLKGPFKVALKINPDLVIDYAIGLQDLSERIAACLSQQDVTGAVKYIQEFICQLPGQSANQTLVESLKESLNEYALNMIYLPSLTRLLKRSEFTTYMAPKFEQYLKINPANAAKYIIKTEAVLSEAYKHLDAFDRRQPIEVKHEVLTKFNGVCETYAQEIGALQGLDPAKDLDFFKLLLKSINNFKLGTLENCFSAEEVQASHSASPQG